MSGSLAGIRVLIFKNDKKNNEKAPDYRLCFSENIKKEKIDSPQKSQVDGENNPFNDTEVPF
jgi:uncharacterized protein (DUF736 family)